MSVKRDMARSHEIFGRLVWPSISSIVGGEELVQTENSNHRTDKDLDALAGIDGYQIMGKQGMRGLASRVQYVDPESSIGYELSKTGYTFTLRLGRESGATTEYEKRLNAATTDRGLLLPHLTVHSYFTSSADRMLGVAIVKTRDLFLHTEDCRKRFGDWHAHRTIEGPLSRCYRNRVTHDGAASFLVVPWRHIACCDVDIRMVINEELCKASELKPLHAERKHVCNEPAQQSLFGGKR